MNSILSFNGIPSNLRVPGFYFEFDASGANTGSILHKVLIIGSMLSTGSALAEQPYRMTSAEEADTLFGRGAMLAAMVKTAFAQKSYLDIWALPLADVDTGSGGVAASASLTVTGSASDSAPLAITIGGQEIRVGIASGQTQNAIASAIVAAINTQTDLPVTAAVNGGNTNQVDITARHTGEFGNDITITVEFIATSAPTAPTFNSNGKLQLAGGATNPDITAALASLGDDWYRWIAMPYTDAANLAVLDTELTERFGPVRKIGGRAFIAYRGTNGQALAFGDSLNSPHISCMGASLSPQPTYLWAAANTAAAAKSLANNPARQLQGIELVGIQPPEKVDRFSFPQRNLALYDGISTYTVDAGGKVRIEAQITTYQENALGTPDDSMLYVNTLEIYESYRYEQRILFAPHAQDLLAEDSPNLPAGKPIMTPKMAKGLLKAWYRDFIVGQLGWCEKPEEYEPQVVKNGNRLEFVDNPNFIENLRQIYGRSALTL